MFRKILVPVDVSIAKETQKLLRHAKTLAEQWGSEVHVVSVIPNVGMPIVGSYLTDDFEASAKAQAQEELDQHVADIGVHAKTHVLTGRIYDKVIGLANSLDADLILIGAHQPGFSDYLLGSNAARLVRHSHKSVLVLRDN